MRAKKTVLIILLLTLVFTALYAETDDTLMLSTEPIYYGEESFIERINERTNGNREPIGLVLTGGSARAFAHIGVLKYLEENDIVPDFIIGNSMGSIVGLMYAAGMSPDQILEAVTSVDVGSLFDLSLPINRGLLNADRFAGLITEYVGDKDISELEIPVMVICEDLTTKRQVRICEGDFSDVMKASFAITVYFDSVKYNDHLLVDGGAIDIAPADIAFDYGNLNIVSTTFYTGKGVNLKNPISALNTAIDIGKRRNGMENILAHPEVIWIRCNVEDFSFMDFAKAAEMVEKGYESCKDNELELRNISFYSNGITSEIDALRKGYDSTIEAVNKKYKPFEHIAVKKVSAYPSINGRTSNGILRNDLSLGVGYSLNYKDLSLDAGIGFATRVSTEASYFRAQVSASAEYFILDNLKLSADFTYFIGSNEFIFTQALAYRFSDLFNGHLDIEVGEVFEMNQDADIAAQIYSLFQYSNGTWNTDFKTGVSYADKSYGWNADILAYFCFDNIHISFAELINVDNIKLGVFGTADVVSENFDSFEMDLRAGIDAGFKMSLLGIKDMDTDVRVGWNLIKNGLYCELEFSL